MRRYGRIGLLAAAIGVLACISLPGCGGASAADGNPKATIEERDFKIDVPATLPAGEVDLEVHNRGPIAHELIVVRGTTASLPLRSDGVTVDEDSIEPRIAAALEPAEAGTHELTADLRPGRYVLLCNMSGHFRGGMHQEVVVR